MQCMKQWRVLQQRMKMKLALMLEREFTWSASQWMDGGKSGNINNMIILIIINTVEPQYERHSARQPPTLILK